VNWTIRQSSFVSFAFVVAANLFGCAVQPQNVENTVQFDVAKPSETVEKSPQQISLPNNPKLTVAGKNAGLIKLGDTRERMLELFPKKPNVDFEYNYDKNCCECEYSDYHWLPPDYKTNGLFFYLKQERIYQISVQSDLFPTVEGIKQESTPQEVRRNYPNANKAFVYLNSGGKENGGRNLVYWVANDSGIAFEFYYHPKKRRRFVNAVIVFEPKSEFQPDGCTASETREFAEIEPFTVEPSEQLQLDYEKRNGIKRSL